MANTYEPKSYLWTLDTIGEVVATGKAVVIDHVIYIATTKDHVAVLQHADGSAALTIKAGATDASPVLWRAPKGGLLLNGMKLASKDSGTLYIYLVRGK
jgi:hypothetical protein